jgi:hypothetical protein
MVPLSLRDVGFILAQPGTLSPANIRNRSAVEVKAKVTRRRIQEVVATVTPCRMQFGDTAECNSALRGLALALDLNSAPLDPHGVSVDFSGLSGAKPHGWKEGGAGSSRRD